MAIETYIDLEILASVDAEYLVSISKDTLNALVSFDQGLTIRHWAGDKPVVLEPYGETAVRTQEDTSASNNLTELPNIDAAELVAFIGLKDEE